MNPYLLLRLIWQDDHMIEIEAIAQNEDFSAETQVYLSYRDLERFASELECFPRSNDHRVTFLAGKSDSYAYLAAHVYCFNKVGHMGIQVSVESNTSGLPRSEQRSRAQFEIQVEPAAIDKFAKELHHLVASQGGEALLIGVPAKPF